MSMTDVKKFIKAVDKDPELQKKMKLAGENYTGDLDDIERIITENVIPFAKEIDFDFSAREYRNFLEEKGSVGKLDEDDLERVVGGQGDTYYINMVVVYLPGVSPKETL